MRRNLHPIPPKPTGLVFPQQPHASRNSQTSQTSQAVHALTSALSNPYGQSPGYSAAYSSHYVHAYMHASSYAPLATPEGYTISSTYVSGSQDSTATSGSSSRSYNTPLGGRSGAGPSHFPNSSNPYGQWYEPGNCRCTYQQCAFTGSKKSVEIHMMDHHLIHPPGWDKQKRKPDWDADPSLKGKPIPILGTGIVLETPEDIDTWIAERKKRWPSAATVQEKEQNLRDAIARGQISAEDSGLRGRKRQKLDPVTGSAEVGTRGLGRGGRGRGRGRETVGTRGRVTDGGWRGRGYGRGNMSQLTHSDAPISKIAVTPARGVSDDADSDSGASSSSDMDPEKDAISSKVPHDIVKDIATGDEPTEQVVPNEVTHSNKEADFTFQPHAYSVSDPVLLTGIQPVPRKAPAQPKKAPHNPFGSRPSLLRNLLLPEIRMTVSNLSQAIRFLADNDFLEGVELQPGETDKKVIEIISESTAADSSRECTSDYVVPISESET